MKKLLCFIGIHNYKFDLVFTIRKGKHCKGIEEMGHDSKPHWHDGRECSVCKKQQYFYYYWIECGYENAIKP